MPDEIHGRYRWSLSREDYADAMVLSRQTKVISKETSKQSRTSKLSTRFLRISAVFFDGKTEKNISQKIVFSPILKPIPHLSAKVQTTSALCICACSITRSSREILLNRVEYIDEEDEGSV